MKKKLIVWMFFFTMLMLPLVVLKIALDGLQSSMGVLRPDVILVTIDTCRDDTLGAYGHARTYTPVLDRLTLRGCLFQNAYSPIPTTAPAHTTILTGTDPKHHRVLRNGEVYRRQFQSMPEILKDNGYQTSAFISGYSLTQRVSGLNSGFDVYDDSWSETAVERSSEGTVRAFANWLQDIPDGPMFSWVHFFDPHSPYDPPFPYAMMMDTLELPPMELPGSKQNKYNAIVQDALDQRAYGVLVKDPTTVQTDAHTLQDMRRKYDAEVCRVDAAIGAIVDLLRDLNRLDNALIIVCSDHGEGFDHDYFYGHGDRLWESAVRIPGIFRFPRDEYAGLLTATHMKLADIFPTILDIAGLSVRRRDLDGESLQRLISHGIPRLHRTWIAVAPPLPRPTLSNGLITTISDPRFKVIRENVSGKTAMYDLWLDPGETDDVSIRYPSEYDRLVSRLDHYLLDSRLPAKSGTLDLTAKDREKLRQLGYVEP